jgi:putative membrane protein
MKQYINYFVKGMAVGIANIIPGVSGGTIALITGIFERLIDAIKSFDLKTMKLLVRGDWKGFTEKTDFYFLLTLFAGVGIAIIALAKIFDFLFQSYPVYIWAYFFGLVLASVYFVGKTVERWKISVILSFIIGTAIAVGVSLINPATANDNFFYLVLCGVVAICSMILPGLSGSFVLILMGNYQLIAIDAINNRDFSIIIPVGIGAVAGLIAFSHVLSWVFKRFKDQTIAMLTGFILGSLSILWPWKEPLFLTDAAGDFIMKHGEKVIARYSVVFPEQINTEVLFAVGLMILGVLSIVIVEKVAQSKPVNNE